MPESFPNVLKTYVDDPAAAPLAKLQANAISGAQDVVIGMASSAPAASIGLTIEPLAAATAYGSGGVILLTAIPMLVIANADRRLNLWNANTGASFEWVGRAINPYLGFITGFLMIAAYVIATVSGVEVLGPSSEPAGVPGHIQDTWPLSMRCQPCGSSNQVTIRPPRRRHPHRAARAATS